MKEEINKEILENIENPIVKKALQKRCASFMFNYGDSDEHSDINHVDKSYRRYNDAWKRYTDHEDYIKPERYHDEYYDMGV